MRALRGAPSHASGPDGIVTGPLRTCVGCRARRPQDELVRVVARPDGSLELGRALPGRGAWLCAASSDCLEAAVRRRALSKALRRDLPASASAHLATTFGLGHERGAGVRG